MRVEWVVELVQGEGAKFLKIIKKVMITLQKLILQVLNPFSRVLKSFRALWISHQASCLLYWECRSVQRKNAWYRTGQPDPDIFSNFLHTADSQWNTSMKYADYKMLNTESAPIIWSPVNMTVSLDDYWSMKHRWSSQCPAVSNTVNVLSSSI